MFSSFRFLDQPMLETLQNGCKMRKMEVKCWGQLSLCLSRRRIVSTNNGEYIWGFQCGEVNGGKKNDDRNAILSFAWQLTRHYKNGNFVNLVIVLMTVSVDDNNDDDEYLHYNRVHSRVKFVCHHVVLLVNLQGVSIVFVVWFVGHCCCFHCYCLFVLCHCCYHRHYCYHHNLEHHGYDDQPDQEFREVDEAKHTKPSLPSTSTNPPVIKPIKTNPLAIKAIKGIHMHHHH